MSVLYVQVDNYSALLTNNGGERRWIGGGTPQRSQCLHDGSDNDDNKCQEHKITLNKHF